MAEGREVFECGPSLRIEAQERMTALQFAQLNTQMGKLEAMMERLERRLWLAVYGVVAVVLAQAFEQLLHVAP
ncbi:MAG: hypothetical protein AAGL89_13080 [Pseudomonadota bacterium]